MMKDDKGRESPVDPQWSEVQKQPGHTKKMKGCQEAKPDELSPKGRPKVIPITVMIPMNDSVGYHKGKPIPPKSARSHTQNGETGAGGGVDVILMYDSREIWISN